MSMEKLLAIKHGLKPFLFYESSIVPKATCIIVIFVFLYMIWDVGKYYKHSQNMKKHRCYTISNIADEAIFRTFWIAFLIVMVFGILPDTIAYSSSHVPHMDFGRGLSLDYRHSINQSIKDKKELPKLQKKVTYIKDNHTKISQKSKLSQNAIKDYQKDLQKQIKHDKTIVNDAKTLRVSWYYYL